MPNSENGWPVNPARRSRLVAGTDDVRVTVADGPAGDVLMYVLAQFHARVEPLTWDSVRGELDDWGYANRPIRGGTSTSNHASGTAVDANATRHALGAVGTFTAAQVAQIRAILIEVGGTVRWGGDYTGRKDEMHFEINADYPAVAAVAARLTTHEEDDMAGEGPNILAALMTGGDSTRQLRPGYVPKGVDPTSILGRVADVQFALTAALPVLLGHAKTATPEALAAVVSPAVHLSVTRATADVMLPALQEALGEDADVEAIAVATAARIKTELGAALLHSNEEGPTQ